MTPAIAAAAKNTNAAAFPPTNPPPREQYASSPLNDVSPFELAAAIDSLPGDSADPALLKFKHRSRPILDFMRNEAEIQSACRKLEFHRKEFNAFIKDNEHFIDRVQTLFAKERFSPFHITADEIQTAFESIGFPDKSDDDDNVWFSKIDRVILSLMNKDRRDGLAMGLLLLLPEFVSSGRFIDAWPISLFASES